MNISLSTCRLCIIILSALIAVTATIVYTMIYLRGPADEPSVVNSIGSRATSTLQFVVVVTRHGHRSPYFEYPSNAFPAGDRRMWPYGKGQLTSRGQAKMYNLGRKIRCLYNGFLNDVYYDDDFKAHSTLVGRTMASAALFLAGLFPTPKYLRMSEKQVSWQPVPVYPNYLDHTKYMKSSESECPRFRQDQIKSMKKFEEDHRMQLMDLLDYLEPHTGFNVSNIIMSYFALAAFDPLTCAEDEGLPLPSWSLPVFPEPISSLAAKQFVANLIGTDTMIRLLQGQLFQEIIGLMQAKVNATMNPDRRMHYYSGHDATILGLRGILGLGGSEQGIVTPGSAFIFELHNDLHKDGPYVEVLYIDGRSTDMEPKTIKVGDCGDTCQFDHLRNMTEKYYDILDYNKECQGK